MDNPVFRSAARRLAGQDVASTRSPGETSVLSYRAPNRRAHVPHLQYQADHARRTCRVENAAHGVASSAAPYARYRSHTATAAGGRSAAGGGEPPPPPNVTAPTPGRPAPPSAPPTP